MDGMTIFGVLLILLCLPAIFKTGGFKTRHHT